MKAIKQGLLIALILLILSTPISANAETTAPLDGNIQKYTQYLLTLEEIDNVMQEESSCQYLSAITMKTLSKGIMVRSLYLCPGSDQTIETIILFTPRNFRVGEGTQIVNKAFRLRNTTVGIGDWSIIISWEFSNPAVLFTKNNAWVVVRAWKEIGQIDTNYPTEQLTALAQKISEKLPNEFTPLILPDRMELKTLSESEFSPSPDSSVDWQNQIWFVSDSEAIQSEQNKVGISDQEIEFNMQVEWMTYNKLILKNNGTEGAIFLDVPPDLTGEILIVHTGSFPLSGQFVQAWIIREEEAIIDLDVVLLPDNNDDIIQYLNLEQQNFYRTNSPIVQEHDQHKFLVFYNDELVAQYPYHVRAEIDWGN